jgi:hypothetical protein
VTNHSLLLFLPLLLAGLGLFYFLRSDKGRQLIDQHRQKPDLTDPNSWIIGPIYNDQPNPSLNMPLHPVAATGGFALDMPTPDCQPHYVTANYGSLTGKTRITMTGRIEGGPLFAKDGKSQASLCLYFQRQFDDWRAIQSDPPQDSDTETFRWYATGSALLPLVAGPFTLTAEFTDKWTAVQYSDSLTKPGAFKAAVDNAGEVGFVLGGGDGWGHGIMAPNPTKIIVTGYVIE